MSVSQLIDMLKKMPQDLEVYDSSWELVEYVCTATWEHTNYPYDKPDKEIVMIV